MLIVLDCNVLLVSVSPKSKYHPIFNAILNDKLALAVSNEIVFEYFEIISDKMGQSVAVNVIETILSLKRTLRTEPHFRFGLIKVDADDNKYCDVAVSSGVDYLVTNDTHFNVLKTITFPKVDIMNAEEFLNLIKHL